MKKIPALLTVTLGLMLAGSIGAATFTVDIVADDADAHDINPGDGICRDSLNACPLRAAIEESNANGGTDTILFANSFVNQTLVISNTEGPLPVISGRVFMLGSSIDAYNSSATQLRDAPPQFFISGAQLSSPSENGLVFSTAGASGSIVSAMGVVNFPGSGIIASFDADDLIIDRNYIGVLANGSAAGNGINGFRATASGGHRIGKARNIDNTGFTGLGNVISSNGQTGVRLETSGDNVLRGNLIGISPSGMGDRGNGQYGVHISGSNNDVGDFTASASAGNFIAANDFGGILGNGSGNRMFANTLGKGETGSFIDSELDGIVIFGTNNFVGTGGRGRNQISEHAGSAIRLGSIGGGAASANFVLNNEVGSAGSQFPLLLSSNGDGINVANGNNNAILDNISINAVGNTSLGLFGNGITVRGNGNSISGNTVGFVNSISGPVAEPNQQGIVVIGDSNTVGSEASRNEVGGNLGSGVGVFGDFNAVRFNYLGVTDSFALVGNTGRGLVVQNATSPIVENNVIGANESGVAINSVVDMTAFVGNWIGIAPDGRNIGNAGPGLSIQSSNDNDFQLNHIAFNSGNGIETNGNVSGLAWFQNRMHDNDGIGIDLGSDGISANDVGDGDEGPNRLQNFPVIENVVLDSVAVPPTLTISYRVDSSNGTAAYPMFVDFYWSDIDETAQGRFFLGTDFNYTVPNALRTVTLNFVDGVAGGWITATALEQDRNTSELAERRMFGVPSQSLFADGFE